jgi:UTP--glucose-1-phosphate uridylyltransferase
MLPIVDKPTIQFIVEEALKSGIEDILIVTGKAKRPIEDHFDSNIELEMALKEKGKEDLLKLVEETTDINLHFIRQSHPKGLGHAVLQAKSFIGEEPFVVMLGDDLMESELPLTKQLINDYEKTHASTIAVMKVPHQDVDKYGVIAPEGEVEKGLYNVANFVEKPAVADAPSDLAIIGRYLLTPEIFNILENQTPGAGNEIQLTDAIETLNKTQRVLLVNSLAAVMMSGINLVLLKRRLNMVSAIHKSKKTYTITSLKKEKSSKKLTWLLLKRHQPKNSHYY